MDQDVITYNHPIEGYFQIRKYDNWVGVSCRWPFDIEADDWVEIQNRFGLSDYTRAVQLAIAGDCGKAEGIEGGFITIQQSGAERTSVEVSNIAEGWAAKSLQIKIAEPVASFMIAD